MDYVALLGKVTYIAGEPQVPQTLRLVKGECAEHTILIQRFLNDGAGYLSRNGSVRATQVLDTLHNQGEIPPTAAIFVNPGNPQVSGNKPADERAALDQRSFEYDSVTASYGKFLVQEIIPLAQSHFKHAISNLARNRIVCGISSGGICAFSSAWFFPQQFANVISHCGSFTNIRGGHN